jgi:hypothetical protein
MRLFRALRRLLREFQDRRSLKQQLRAVQDVRPCRHWPLRMLNRVRRFRLLR